MGGDKKNVQAILKEVELSISAEKELDYFLTHQNRYRYILNRILELKLSPDGKILDVGCYPPHLFSSLQKMGYKLWGISSKHEPMESKNVIPLDIEKDQFPFKANSFDLVIFTEIMEHLVGNPDNYLSKIRRALKKGGRLIVTTPNVAHLKNRAKLAIGKNIYFSLSQLKETNCDTGSIYYRHNREYTKEELVQLFESEGFRIVKADYFSSYSPFRRKITATPFFFQVVKIGGFLLTYIHPSLQDTIYLEVKKR